MLEGIDVTKEKWGYIRETKEQANKAGRDPDTGLHRTGLEEYLAVIFPGVDDWVHDQTIKNLPQEVKKRVRPDYRSESLKMIVEVDGKPHYDNPECIRKDLDNTAFYESLGYTVVRIPFFIQLSNKAVKKLFGVEVEEPLFNEKIPSMGPKGLTPGKLCGAGVMRMACEFKSFPEQYLVNVEYLKQVNDDFLTGVSLLEAMYQFLNNT